MCDIKIRLRSLKDIIQFQEDIKDIAGDIKIVAGTVKMSARSIMNMFILDLTDEINVVYRGNDAESFYSVVSKYIQ